MVNTVTFQKLSDWYSNLGSYAKYLQRKLPIAMVIQVATFIRKCRVVKRKLLYVKISIWIIFITNTRVIQPNKCSSQAPKLRLFLRYLFMETE